MAEKEQQTIKQADVATLPASVIARGIVDNVPKPKVSGTGVVKPPSPERAKAYGDFKSAREALAAAQKRYEKAKAALEKVDADEKAAEMVEKMTPAQREAIKKRL